jgi:hypothetical protein
MVAAGARQLALLSRGGLVLQQLTQAGSPGRMQSGAKRTFDGFQIQVAAVPALGKDTAQQLVYFPRNFLMDCSSRFFYWSVQPPRCGSTGRSAQIFSLMSTKSWLSS